MAADEAARAGRDAAWRDLADALAGASTPQEVLAAVARTAPAGWGAQLVNVSLLDPDGEHLRLVTAVRTPDDVRHEFAVYSATAPLPSTDALRTGRPVLLTSLADRDARYPALKDVEVAEQSFAVLPLVHAGRALGVLGLGWPQPQTFTGALVDDLERLARVSAAALARAELFRAEAERRARAERTATRLETLYRLSTALSAATTPDDVARTVLSTCMPALGASAATLTECDGRQPTRFLAFAGLPWETTDLPIEGLVATPLVQRQLRTRRPVLVESFEDRERQFPGFAGDGIRQQAWANLPLIVEDRVVGLMAFGWDDPRTFTSGDEEFLTGLARHAAIALDRAQLLEGSRSIAETLQRALLPRHPPAVAGWELATYYRPAVEDTQVGGDWYDVFPVDRDRLGLVVGDVMGKGVEAAGTMGSVRAALRALATLDSDPGVVFDRLDRVLDVYEVPGFATACYLRLDIATGRVDHAVAGHVPPLRLRHPGGHDWVHATHEPDGTPGPGGLPLGALPATSAASGYRTGSFVLAPGEVVVIYTDGLVERRGQDLDVGLAALADAAPALRDAPDLPAAVDRLVRGMSGTTNVDDIAVVVLRRLPGDPGPAAAR